MESTSAIEIERLSINLGGHFRALTNVNLNLSGGQIIGLLGPSGAGKTTLIRAIVGRHRLSHGSIRVFGLPAGDKKLRSQIGYMPQSPSVYNDLNIYENLRYFAVMSGRSKNDVREAIDEVDLAPYAGQVVSTLSGGQKNRVSLAAALLGRPQLLILDEPTVGVDPLLRQRLWQIFNKLAGEGRTLIVTSHVMEEAIHCDDLVFIRHGKLLAHGSPKDLREQTGAHTMEAAFLDLARSEEAKHER